MVRFDAKTISLTAFHTFAWVDTLFLPPDVIDGLRVDGDDLRFVRHWKHNGFVRKDWRVPRRTLATARKAKKLKVCPDKPSQVLGYHLLDYLKGKNRIQ